MNFELINGTFTRQEAIDLITRLINVKIKFHERKIETISDEAEIRNREQRIKELQRDLYELTKNLESRGEYISIKSDIKL